MIDTPYVNDGADESLRKTVSLLNKIEAKTGSATITGPVTVTNEVEVTNSSGSPIPVSGTVTANTGLTQPLTNTELRLTAVPVSLASAPVTPVTDNGGSLTVDGTVTVNDMTSGNAKTKIVDSVGADVSYITSGTAGTPSASVLSVQGISGGISLPISGYVSVSNLPATQAISGTIGTFASALVNAGSAFSYSAAGSYGVFDAGVDADYVEFRLDGGGGGFSQNLSLSSSNSPYSAVNSTAATLVVFNDKFPSSSLDTTAYRFSNTSLNSGTPGTYVLSLWHGGIRCRYVRVDVTGGGGGGWFGRFDSYKSAGLAAGIGVSSRILNRVPIAGVVDINSCTRELPVNDSVLISNLGTTAEVAAPSDLAQSSISGLFRRLLVRITDLLPANLTVSSTRLLVDGSGVTQPVSIASAPVTPVSDNGGSLTVDGTITAAQATASSLKAQAQILDSAGSLLTYAATGTAGTPGVDVVSIQGVSSGVAVTVSGPVTDTQLRASAISVSDRGSVGQATVTTFTSTSSLVLMASNSARKLLTVFNEGAGVLYLLYGAGTASITNYSVRINSGDYLEIEKYTGAVTGIFGTAGTARATEIS